MVACSSATVGSTTGITTLHQGFSADSSAHRNQRTPRQAHPEDVEQSLIHSAESFPPLFIGGRDTGASPAVRAGIRALLHSPLRRGASAKRVAHMFDGPFKLAWNGPSLWATARQGLRRPAGLWPQARTAGLARLHIFLQPPYNTHLRA